jgi:GTP pyrophosphokinase
VGAKVNGRLVTLNHILKSGDSCEIFTAKSNDAGPSKDWLDFVGSPRARNKIRQWFSRERREEMIELGRDELIEELRREGISVQGIWSSDALESEVEAAGHGDLDTLLAALGEGTTPAREVAARLAAALRADGRTEFVAGDLRIDRPRYPGNAAVIHVEGIDDVLVRLSTCCSPSEGDEITGFMTRGGAVSVHRADCPQTASLARDPANRLIDVEWSVGDGVGKFRTSVEVVALDRTRLLRDVANALSDQHVNIVACSTLTGPDRVARMRFEFEFADPGHIESVLRTMKNIDSVFDAYRVPTQIGDSETATDD